MIASYPPRRSFDIHERNGCTKVWAYVESYENVINELLQTISESVVKVDSWMARLRPDLSYIPADGG